MAAGASGAFVGTPAEVKTFSSYLKMGSLCAGLGKGDVKIFVSPETLKVQKETLPTEEGLFLVSY